MKVQPSPATATGQPLRVIIPTRNEAEVLPGLLEELRAQQGLALRVTVVDGQSSDNTVERARAGGAEVLHSLPGRGLQMNVGWKACTEQALLFLHADSRLPHAELLALALQAWEAEPEHTAGHFRLEFVDTPQPKPRLYRWLEHKSAHNRPQSFNGDQGLLIRRSLLQQLGGFDHSLPFLEDQAIGAAIHAQGRFITLPGALQTSARRFEAEGRAQRYLAMLLIMCARQAGCHSYLRQLPQLYREQTAIDDPLDPLPLLLALREQVQDQPDFWDCMAEYSLEQSWQLPLLLEHLSGLPLLAGWDRHAHRLHRLPGLRPLLAQALKLAFRDMLPVLLRAQRAD